MKKIIKIIAAMTVTCVISSTLKIYAIAAQDLKDIPVPLVEGIEELDCVGSSEVSLSDSYVVEMEDGVTYEYILDEAGNAIITECTARVAELVIPEALDGHTVVGVDGVHGYYILRKVKIPDSVIEIGNYAFSECNYLEEAYLPKSLKRLGNFAFADCSNLNYIEIPKNLEEAYAPFYNCSSLQDVTFEEGITRIPDFLFNTTGLNEIEIPDTVTEIGDYAFGFCQNLSDVRLPESLETLGALAFVNCGLTSIEIPKNLSVVDLERENESPFGGCSKLRTATFEEGTTIIPSNLFRHSGLAEVEIPNSVTEIGDYAFSGCTDLTKIEIPENVTNIGRYAYGFDCIYAEGVNPDVVICTYELMPGCQIIGTEGSTAQKYAEENEITFIDKATINPFGDVKESDWYYPYAKFAIDNNLMSGKGTTPDGGVKFDPAANMTRAEFVQVLYSKEGKPNVTYKPTFTDVKENDWFAKAVIWANENGIVAGSGDKFDVSGNITREQMTAILYKYAKFKEYNVDGAADLTSFVDDEKVSSWAVGGMQWAVKNGVINGKKDTATGGLMLAPQGHAIRAEAATMLKSFIEAHE